MSPDVLTPSGHHLVVIHHTYSKRLTFAGIQNLGIPVNGNTGTDVIVGTTLSKIAEVSVIAEGAYKR